MALPQRPHHRASEAAMRGVGAKVMPRVEVEARVEMQAGAFASPHELAVRRRLLPLRDLHQRLSI